MVYKSKNGAQEGEGELGFPVRRSFSRIYYLPGLVRK